MPKLYYPTPDELQGTKPLDEDLWFPRNQSRLLRLANTNEGRDILCIDSFTKMPFPTVKMGKNFVRYYLGTWDGKHWYRTDFRIGAKWGNVIRYRWQEFKKALDRQTFLDIMRWPAVYDQGKRLLPVGGGIEVNFFPDPNPESTSVDGNATRAANGNFATIRGGNGTTHNDTGATEGYVQLANGNTTDTFDQLIRSFFFFDTSALPDGDNLDNATCDFVFNSKSSDFSGDIYLVNAILASNTDVVDADYQGTVGANTQQATGLAISGLTVDDSAYSLFTLNSTGLASIVKDGITKFGLKTEWDADNGAPPSWGSSYDDDKVNGRFADNSGTSSDPRLVVVHSSPFTPKVIMF